MEENEAVGLFLEQVRLFSDSYLEVDSPCARMLADLGVCGVDALAGLVRDAIGHGDEAVPSYAAHLLAHSGLPGSVDVLTDLLVQARSSATLPYETLAEIFDDVIAYDRFLTDPRFVAAARDLSRRWSDNQLDGFLAATEGRLKPPRAEEGRA